MDTKFNNIFDHKHGLEGLIENDEISLSASFDTLYIDNIKVKAFGKNIVLKRFEIPFGRIDFFDYVTEEEVKNKSVLARGAVGAIILGPVGAVIGGMSGIGTKKKKGNTFLTINYASSSGDTNTIILSNSPGWSGSDVGDAHKIKKLIDVYRNQHNAVLNNNGNVEL